MIEYVIIGSSGKECVLRIVEYNRELGSMSGKEIRNGGLNPEIIMVSAASCGSMVLGQAEYWSDEKDLISELECLMELVA
jgi:hypothetical protein